MTIGKHEGKTQNNIIKYFQSTKRARYKAANRYTLKAKSAKFAIFVNSAILIFLSILQLSYADKLDGQQQTIIASFVLLVTVITLLQSYFSNPENFIANSINLDRCGNEINRLYFNYKEINMDKIPEDKYKEIVNEYYSILDKYNSHMPIDYSMSVVEAKERHSDGKITAKEYITKFIFYSDILSPLASTLLVVITVVIVFANYNLGNTFQYVGKDKKTTVEEPSIKKQPIEGEVDRLSADAENK